MNLVPTRDNYGIVFDIILEAYNKSGVSLSECLDGDSSALSREDMRYFDKKWFGKVPNYGQFVLYLNRLPRDLKDAFEGCINEIESGRTVGEMEGVIRSGETGRDIKDRFYMMDKLNSIYEKKLDRIEKRRGIGIEKSVDMASRIIKALSDAELIKVIGEAEVIEDGRDKV